MKIQSTLPTKPVATPQSETKVPAREEKTGSAAHVSLSDDARWVAGVADEIRRSPEVRQDVVDKTRAALLDGSFEKGVDMDALIDRLARDL